MPELTFSLLVLLSGIFTVKQQSAALLERFGRFQSVKGSGLQFKIPFVDRVAGRVSLKIQQLDVLVETKTKDDVFERKDDIANAIKRELTEAMEGYGYGIVKALVTDIDPDHTVKNAMNRINAAEREKLAAEYKGEAEL